MLIPNDTECTRNHYNKFDIQVTAKKTPHIKFPIIIHSLIIAFFI